MTLIESIQKHIPQKTCKSQRDLPWLNHNIKKGMHNRKCLYDRAKRTNAPTDWNAYCKARNLVKSKLEVAHCDYQRRLFDKSFTGNKTVFEVAI